MIHRGEIVKKRIEEMGVSKTYLSKAIGYSRRHLYALFNDPELSSDIIVKIGKYINHDFAEDFAELPFIVNEPPIVFRPTKSMTGSECLQRYSQLWDKYTQLLEDYKDLSDRYNTLQSKYS